jgi:signal transduction histidine kinase
MRALARRSIPASGSDVTLDEPGSEGGYGLSAMRDRVSRIAGTLEVESEPGGGTAISACVPAITVGAAATYTVRTPHRLGVE